MHDSNLKNGDDGTIRNQEATVIRASQILVIAWADGRRYVLDMRIDKVTRAVLSYRLRLAPQPGS